MKVKRLKCAMLGAFTVIPLKNYSFINQLTYDLVHSYGSQVYHYKGIEQYSHVSTYSHMSLDVTRAAFRVSDKVRLKPACSVTETR